MGSDFLLIVEKCFMLFGDTFSFLSLLSKEEIKYVVTFSEKNIF